MNILLIAPRDEQYWQGLTGFPYGLAYISAAIKQTDHNVTCVNLNHTRCVDIDDTIRNAINANDIDIVATGGFSCYFLNIKRIVRVAKDTKRDIVVIVGGAIITGAPIVMAQELGIDYGVMGEGERTIVELLDAIACHKPTEEIDGLVCKNNHDNSGYFLTRERRTPLDLDFLPLPDYDGFGFRHCVETQDGDDRSALIFGSRSCPFKCTFCFHSTGNQYRQRSINAIIEEVRYIVDKYGVNYISFTDDIFFTTEQRANEFCEAISQTGIRYSVQLRVSDVNDAILKKLKASGCTCVSYGIESHSQKILDSMKKPITIEQIDEALELTYNNELDIQGNFIFGDSAETVDTASETLKWFHANKKYHINISRIFTAPGAEIYEQAKKRHLIDDEIEFIKNKDYVLNLTSMTPTEYEEFSRTIQSYAGNPLMRLDYVPQQVLLSHNANDTLYSFVACCVHCGATGVYENFFRIDRLKYDDRYQFIRCKKCNRRFFIDVQAQFAIDAASIASKLRGGKIFVWGTGKYATDAYGLFLKNLDIVAFVDGWARVDSFMGHPVIRADDFIADPRGCTDIIIAFSKPEFALERIYNQSNPNYNIVPLLRSSISAEMAAAFGLAY